MISLENALKQGGFGALKHKMSWAPKAELSSAQIEDLRALKKEIE